MESKKPSDFYVDTHDRGEPSSWLAMAVAMEADYIFSRLGPKAAVDALDECAERIRILASIIREELAL